ncbi:MAG TPA: TonB-dependent receptor, partial [Kofleriaceae bacterium]|nr:TonB-dependent receptor [Kofleriaceae bacterium]
GYILGAPDLRPERGPSADLGGGWAPAAAMGEFDRIVVEAAAFATHARDTISFISSAGTVARAANLGTTETYGGELVASARIAKTASITAAYTRLVSEQLSGDPATDGKELPRRPAHALYARGDVVRRIADRVASVWLDASVESETFLDPANLGRVPARTLVGAGARVEIVRGVAVAIAVANLADVRIAQLPLSPPPSPTFTETPTAVADVAGFPLPGRSFYLSVDWTH